MKSFPPPLTAEEEQYYIQKYADGDPQAKSVLIERNLRLVAHVMKKYQHLEDDPEDLLSIGVIGLIKAVTTYRTGRNTRLATYACRCIENEILMMLRSKRKCSRETSLYEPIGTDRDGNEIQLFDILEAEGTDALRQVTTRDDALLLYSRLESDLTERERLVLKMRYGLYGGEEYTQREIAGRLGISRSYVSRIEKGAIEKLRQHFL